MRNLDLHTINSLDEVGDDTNFIMVIEETDGWVEILQGTRKEIDVNGDGYPLVKIYTV